MDDRIRIATEADAAALTRMVWYVAGHAYRDLGTEQQMTVWLEAHATSELRHLIRAESGGCLLVMDGRRHPRGMIAVDYADATWPPHWGEWGDCRLEAFYVATPGRGVGRALLHEAIAICQEDSRERVFCDVPASAQATRALLEAECFAVVDEHPGITFPEARYVTMARALRPAPLER